MTDSSPKVLMIKCLQFLRDLLEIFLVYALEDSSTLTIAFSFSK